ncbi:MAG TPA: DALR anticodon-binding domain-containing protein, partial [Bdellovibrionales bacterium]|nr:DALR anticodon-binding domain-containing protein [Bdellovibrionales bacterium]
SPEERELIRVLLGYEDTLKNAFHSYKPNVVAQYLLDVCQAFNRFYNQHRILGEPEAIASSRMALVDATRRVLEAGLGVLGISAPDAM